MPDPVRIPHWLTVGLGLLAAGQAALLVYAPEGTSKLCWLGAGVAVGTALLGGVYGLLYWWEDLCRANHLAAARAAVARPDDALRVVPGPVWTDACAHPPASYVFTVRADAAGWATALPVDVYLFADADGRQVPCLRHGPEPSEYYSPATLENVFTRDGYEPYATVARALLARGRLCWVPAAPGCAPPRPNKEPV